MGMKALIVDDESSMPERLTRPLEILGYLEGVACKRVADTVHVLDAGIGPVGLIPYDLRILTRLRLKHIDLSIDDFGTGHTALTELRDIPFNEPEIDRAFVHGAWRDASLRMAWEPHGGEVARPHG